MQELITRNSKLVGLVASATLSASTCRRICAGIGRRGRGDARGVAALGVHGVERSCVMRSSQTTGEERPDDEQFVRIPCHSNGFGRLSAILGSGGALPDRTALSRATNWRKVASEPKPIRLIPDPADPGLSRRSFV